MSTIVNATPEQVIEALKELQKRTKTGELGEDSVRYAFYLMATYPGIKFLDIRGGARVAHAYRWPHQATGMGIQRNENGGLNVTVSRGTGNDLARWAIVGFDPAIREQLKAEIGLDRYNQIYRKNI